MLEGIETIEELKCILRVLALVHQHKGKRLWVSVEELLADTVLLSGLGHGAGGARVAVLRGLGLAVARGMLLQIQGSKGEILYFVNDSPGRRAYDAQKQTGVASLLETPSGNEEMAGETLPNIFALYQDNIGPLAPILAQELEEAEGIYPPSWIAEAFQEAAARNRRNWRYIQRILERWASQGKDHGEPERHSEEADRKEHLLRYGHLAGWDDSSGTRG
ncbi:MAG: DnaD domain protein [Chloroflexi bacterium]|nr:DnaD domain protein [Chloroflexota bacterium]